jgi:hypothetical protein
MSLKRSVSGHCNGLFGESNPPSHHSIGAFDLPVLWFEREEVKATYQISQTWLAYHAEQAEQAECRRLQSRVPHIP